jgi:hypothetical protein
MPTQEENTTILLGVIRDQGRDIKRMVQHLETIDDRLDILERDMESRFEEHGKKLDQILLLLNTLTPKPGQEA